MNNMSGSRNDLGLPTYYLYSILSPYGLGRPKGNRFLPRNPKIPPFRVTMPKQSASYPFHRIKGDRLTKAPTLSWA